MNVIKRLERLEQQITGSADVVTVFRVMVDESGKPIPVTTWRNQSTGELVSRKPGESDDELSQRAVDASGGDSVRYMPVI